MQNKWNLFGIWTCGIAFFMVSWFYFGYFIGLVPTLALIVLALFILITRGRYFRSYGDDMLKMTSFRAFGVWIMGFLLLFFGYSVFITFYDGIVRALFVSIYTISLPEIRPDSILICMAGLLSMFASLLLFSGNRHGWLASLYGLGGLALTNFYFSLNLDEEHGQLNFIWLTLICFAVMQILQIPRVKRYFTRYQGKKPIVYKPDYPKKEIA